MTMFAQSSSHKSIRCKSTLGVENLEDRVVLSGFASFLAAPLPQLENPTSAQVSRSTASSPAVQTTTIEDLQIDIANDIPVYVHDEIFGEIGQGQVFGSNSEVGLDDWDMADRNDTFGKGGYWDNGWSERGDTGDLGLGAVFTGEGGEYVGNQEDPGSLNSDNQEEEEKSQDPQQEGKTGDNQIIITGPTAPTAQGSVDKLLTANRLRFR